MMPNFATHELIMLEVSLAYVSTGDDALMDSVDSPLAHDDYQYGVYVLVPEEADDGFWAGLRMIGFSQAFIKVLSEAYAWLAEPERVNDQRYSRWIKFDTDAPPVEGIPCRT